MAQLVVRNLEQSVKTKLRRRARSNGRSMEEEVREILREATKDDSSQRKGFGSEVSKLFRGIGLKEGEEFPELRGFSIRPVDFEE